MSASNPKHFFLFFLCADLQMVTVLVRVIVHKDTKHPP